MSAQTAISWCDSTFNPWIGCTKISPACDNCYAERLMDHRMHKATWGAGQPRVRTSAANWRLPIKWNAKRFMECADCGWRGAADAPLVGCGACGSIELSDTRRRVFCASLADVFDNEVPSAWRAELFALIDQTPHIDWLLLTKRIGNVAKMIEAPGMQKCGMPSNAWLGITVVNQAEADRDIPKLLETPARVRFLSIEPMLGPIDLRFHIFSEPTGDWRTRNGKRQVELRRPDDGGLHWVICGGESGPHARPGDVEWYRSLMQQCKAAGVPFHMKQITERGKPLPMEQWPADLRVQEFPS